MAYYNNDTSARRVPATRTEQRPAKVLNIEDSEEFQNLKKNSYKQGTGTRTKKKRMVIDEERFKRAFISLVVAVSLATAGLIGGGAHVVNELKEAMVVGEYISEFQRDIINNETHRTLDNEHYYYDYDDIARHMEDRGQFDNDLYCLIKNVGDFQANRVMKYTDYESLDNYLSTNGYEDVEEFLNHQRDEIVLIEEVSKKQSELDQMNSEFGNTTINEGPSYGGK